MDWKVRENYVNETENCENLYWGNQEITQNPRLKTELMIKDEPDEAVDSLNYSLKNQNSFPLSFNTTGKAITGNELIKIEDRKGKRLDDREVSSVSAYTTGRFFIESGVQETRKSLSSDCQKFTPIFSDKIQSYRTEENKNENSLSLHSVQFKEKPLLSLSCSQKSNETRKNMNVLSCFIYDEEFDIAEKCDVLNHSKIHSNSKEEFGIQIPIATKKSRNRTKVREKESALAEDQVNKITLAENSQIIEILLDEEESMPREMALEWECNEKGFTCPYCDRQFEMRGSFANHLKVHSRLMLSNETEECDPVSDEEIADLFTCDRESNNKCQLSSQSKIHLKHIEDSRSPTPKLYEEVIISTPKSIDETRISKTECSEKSVILTEIRTEESNFGKDWREEEIVFTCKICKKLFSEKRNLRRHLKKHQTVSLLNCKFCAMTFSCHSDLRRHDRIHIGSEAVVESKNNSVSSNRMAMLLEEAKLQKVKMGVDFLSCFECQKKFTKLDNLSAHLNCHLKILKYNCKHCKKIFSHPSSLRRHVLTHFDAPKKHECPQCFKKFSTNYLLKRHMSSHNKDLCHFMCDLCDFRAHTVHDLKHHKRVHSEKSIPCDQCSTTFRHKSDLEKHKKIHTGTKDMVCEICDSKFCRIDNLKRHLKVHDSSAFICKFCGANYSNSKTYKKHLISHRSVDPLKKVIAVDFPKALSIYL